MRAKQPETVVARAARECRAALSRAANIVKPTSRYAYDPITKRFSHIRPTNSAEWQYVADRFYAVEQLARETRILAEECAKEATS